VPIAQGLADTVVIWCSQQIMFYGLNLTNSRDPNLRYVGGFDRWDYDALASRSVTTRGSNVMAHAIGLDGAVWWWSDVDVIWCQIDPDSQAEVTSDGQLYLALLKKAVPVIRLYAGATSWGERSAAREALTRLGERVRARWINEQGKGCAISPCNLYCDVTRDSRLLFLDLDLPDYEKRHDDALTEAWLAYAMAKPTDPTVPPVEMLQVEPFVHILKVASTLSPQAQFQMYQSARHVKRFAANDGASVRDQLLQMAAEYGCAEAQFTLGNEHRYRDGRESREAAIHWLDQAAASGFGKARVARLEIDHKGAKGRLSEMRTALNALCALANDADPETRQAVLWYLGKQFAGIHPGRKPNDWGGYAIEAPIECSLVDPWSLPWLIDAAISGAVIPSYVLGRDALSSARVPTDMRLARRFLEQAAGSIGAARIHLAHDLAHGICGPARIAEAKSWLSIAAESEYWEVRTASAASKQWLDNRMSDAENAAADHLLPVLRAKILVEL
jgi:TPR repeat protein